MDKTVARIPVSLNAEDNDLVIKLRSSMEAKSLKRVTVAHIVRRALRALADIELAS